MKSNQDEPMKLSADGVMDDENDDQADDTILCSIIPR